MRHRTKKRIPVVILNYGLDEFPIPTKGRIKLIEDITLALASTQQQFPVQTKLFRKVGSNHDSQLRNNIVVVIVVDHRGPP